MNWHQMHTEDVIKRLGVDPAAGLSAAGVQQARAQYGKNVLAARRGKSLLRRFFSQFSDFMIVILLAAAVISFFTAFIQHDADYIDSIIILFIVTLNAVVGAIQESKAEKAIDALKQLSAPEATVLRGGRRMRIPSADVVVGDLLILETGDFVAADARLLTSADLCVEESALTGESVPVEKQAAHIACADAALGDRRNMVFSSSCVTAGHATAVVVGVGMDTQVGRIAAMINDSEEIKTPLQERLAKTSKVLGAACLVICLVLFVLGLFSNMPPLEMFMISVSLAVAAIPEGLPAVVTIVLALGVRKMADNRAIIRKLPAVETLGSASVICSDKTGTLTKNQMTVTTLHSGFAPIVPHTPEAERVLSLCALCSNTRALPGKNGLRTDGGSPTEAALALAAAENGVTADRLLRQYPRVDEIPFDSTRKRMSTIHRLPDGRFRVITKGAPDVLLDRCAALQTGSGARPLSPGDKTRILAANDQLASQALRVLAVAYRDVSSLPADKTACERDLTFCGLIGMIDPPRPEARAAVLACKQAGVKPVMITGDHVVTAKAIGAQLGILGDGDKAMTGAQLDRIDDGELQKRIFDYAVFARVSPVHKVRIVNAFIARGAVVAMTGDGVNDAPALKNADIGCAMGRGGTDVAKGAADMILTDDNFATIVDAVREGRGIYDNIKKAIHFLLSCNIGEIITVFVAFLLRCPVPLLAIQLLWINLVTDSLPALALGVEPPDADIMRRRPLDRKKSLFADGLWYNILIEGALIGSLALCAFTVGRLRFGLIAGRTIAFGVLSICQLVHAFSMRSEHSLFEIGVFSNKRMNLAFIVCLTLQICVMTLPPLTALFKITFLPPGGWLLIAGFSLVPLLVLELEKRLTRKALRVRRPLRKKRPLSN